MLLNEFLKEHRRVEEQAATIEQQERRLTELERAVAELRWPLHEATAKRESGFRARGKHAIMDWAASKMSSRLSRS